MVNVTTEESVGQKDTVTRTNDKIFLLSRKEVDRYFPSIEKKRIETYMRYVHVWWLRNHKALDFRGYDEATVVNEDGEYDSFGQHHPYYVRPAMWVDLNMVQK